MYHQQEDLNYIQNKNLLFIDGRYTIQAEIQSGKSFEIITKKPISSTEQTIKINPKSRSAKLRVAKRTNSKPIHEIAA